MRSRVIVLMFSVVLAQLTQSADAQVIFSEDFNSYTAGDLINLTNSPWQPKWDGNDTTQQNLFSVESGGAGYAVLDTSVAKRSYRVNGRTPFTMQTGDTVTISTDVRYEHAPGALEAPAALNINFIGLELSDNENWWGGMRKSVSLANRGPAIGNRLSAAPYIEGWQPHSSLGIDTAVGGYSNWLRLDWELTVNGAGNIEGVGTITNLDTETELYTTTPVDLGYLPGTTLYAGYTTDWNEQTGTIETVAKVTEVNLDNFQIDGGELVATPGDIDGDLDVDGADFLEWQRGTPPDPADLTEWQNAYGGVPASISAVPEPTSLALCFLALSVGAGMRRSRS